MCQFDVCTRCSQDAIRSYNERVMGTQKPVLEEGMCSYTLNGKLRMTMEFYHCRTCRLQDSLGMCKACFEECHPNCDAYFSHISDRAYCDCHTLRCKFNDKKYVKDKRLKLQVAKRRDTMQTEKVELSEEHKAQVK